MKSSFQKFLPMIQRDLLLLWIVSITALCAGLLLNQFRRAPLSLSYQNKERRLDRVVDQIITQESGVSRAPLLLSQNLSIDEFKIFVDEKQGLILDARPEVFHRLGHVPGALSLPREDFEKVYTKIKSRLEPYQNRPVAVYCSSSSCEDSRLVKKALLALGYSKVVIFSDGWDGWTGANLGVEK